MEEEKQCKACQEKINKKATKCPHCGAKQGGLPTIVKVIIIVVVIFACVIGCMKSCANAVNETIDEINSGESATEASPSNSTNETTPKEEKFTYTIDTQYNDMFSYYIEGTVKNNKNKEYSYVSIEFVCYDIAGNNLGTALDNTNNLLGNQTWKYKAMFIGSNEEVDHCDFHKISGW
ncbi:MAG: hypothetical protein IJI60_03205 [Bacilli bacterium]|nr:hypothetical protein [Bacilli bacterium]